MLAAESPGVVCHETVSKWSKGNFPHLPDEKAPGDAGVLPGPRLRVSGRRAPAGLLALARLEEHHYFSAICLTAGVPLLNRASRVFTSFAAFSM
jgi:hypothetical protein